MRKSDHRFVPRRQWIIFLVFSSPVVRRTSPELPLCASSMVLDTAPVSISSSDSSHGSSTMRCTTHEAPVRAEAITNQPAQYPIARGSRPHVGCGSRTSDCKRPYLAFEAIDPQTPQSLRVLLPACHHVIQRIQCALACPSCVMTWPPSQGTAMEGVAFSDHRGRRL
jgi:hypothetical protein